MDTVDKPSKPEDVGMTSPPHSIYAVDAVRRTIPHLWIDSGGSTHSLSTTGAYFSRFLYFDFKTHHPPYMGGDVGVKIVYLGELSTRRCTYPQITASYPQIGCLNKQD